MEKINPKMTKQEFIGNATRILKDYGLTEEQANAIANLTVILEKDKLVERGL